MSKNNNVNPGQYKVGGRERQGEDLVQADHKAQYTTSPKPPKAGTPRKDDAAAPSDKRNTE